MHVAGQDQIIDREQQQSAFAVEATQADGSPELKSLLLIVTLSSVVFADPAIDAAVPKV